MNHPSMLQSQNAGIESAINAAGLDPYVPTPAQPWDARRAAHLLRRTGCGAPYSRVVEILATDPQAAVKSIISAAINDPLPALPVWHNEYPPPRGEDRTIFNSDNRTWFAEYRTEWLLRIMNGGLRENLALFWHNHFVTEYPTYTLAAYAVQYLAILRQNAAGNFRTFVREIGTTPAMLYYLNGHQNHKSNPNENYARELLELFTTGLGHYTQFDITEIARALTGWRVDYYTLNSGFIESRHDFGEKTIFGKTGNWGYDDVIELVFTERAQETATHICRKLYRHFIYDEPDETIVDQLANILLANDFELEPVLETLLSSQLFFSDGVIGARIKSPVDVLLGFLTEIGHEVEPEQLYRRIYAYLAELGQIVFYPPDVSGWPGHHFWVSTTTLSLRWYYAELILNGTPGLDEFDPVPLAASITEHADAYELAYVLASRLLSVPVSDDRKQELGEVLLDGTPYYEWDIYATGSDRRLRNYLLHLCRLPEFQLT